MTNYLAFARREFRRCVLDQLREMTTSEEEFRREAQVLLGMKVHEESVGQGGSQATGRNAAARLSGTRYNLVRYVASGGMGSVWLAEDTVLKRRVALKVLDLAAPGDDLDVRFSREARILAGLEHPGIVPVHDAGTLADGRAFCCMKYVEGQTLAQHIASQNLPIGFGCWNALPSPSILPTPAASFIAT